MRTSLMGSVQRRWFQVPWEFRESALFTIIAVFSGFVLQYAGGGRGVMVPQLPYNAIILLLFAAVTLGIGLAFRENATVKWFGGIPLGLCMIVAIALLSLIGGVVPQDGFMEGSFADMLGISRIFSSWPFALTVLLFLANLGLSLAWRLVPFSVNNLQFILFHAGFWIALACGTFGAVDLQRLVIPVEEGQSNNLGYTMGSGKSEELPFSVFLKDFALEEYPPQLFLYNPHTDNIIVDGSRAAVPVHKGLKTSWKGLAVEVLDYLPSALPGQHDEPVAADPAVGIPFAKVRITALSNSQEAWLSTGSPMLRPYVVDLGGFFLMMMPGQPKSFLSSVSVRSNDGHQHNALLEVNKPVAFMGWKLYQMGYDEKAGRWSKLSLIEAIRDPWLPVVYLGFFMIMAGNVLFFWNGIKQKGDA